MVGKGGRKLPSHITNEQAVGNLLRCYSHHELVRLEQTVSHLCKSAGNPICLLAAVTILQNAIRVTEERA